MIAAALRSLAFAATRVGLSLAPLAAPVCFHAQTAAPVEARFGYSRALLQGVNETDFRGAMETYARVIAQNSRIATRNDQRIFTSLTEMEIALRDGSINLLSATAREILALPPDLLAPDFIVAAHGAGTGVEFVLLVRRDRGLHDLAQLQRLTLAVWDSPPTSLSSDWLELELARRHLGDSGSFFAEVRHCTKPGPAVLPVYFGQIEGAVVTRHAFQLLAELNPQLSRQLVVIATSPPVQPLLTAFSRRLDPALREEIVRAMFAIDKTAAGRQVLTLFQTETLAFCEPEVVAATRQLLAEHDRLTRPTPPTTSP